MMFIGVKVIAAGLGAMAVVPIIQLILRQACMLHLSRRHCWGSVLFYVQALSNLGNSMYIQKGVMIKGMFGQFTTNSVKEEKPTILNL